MTNLIDKKLLEHLAKLAKIEIEDSKKEKLLEDFKNILSHIEELNEVNVDNVAPMNGGSELKNVLREDSADLTKAELQERQETRDDIIKAFPESDGDYLKVPAVFE